MRSQGPEPVKTTAENTGEALKTTPHVGGPVSDVLVPGYEVRGWLGRGGMGEVLRVHDPDFDRSLAVKVMLAELADQPGAENRFVAEARITGRLQHPGIPPVHEIGRLDDGRPFLAMKLIEGRTLHELLKQRSTPAGELPRFVAIFGQVCQAVGYAHSQGVIHRDLKPHNVMVGAFGEVQVMDWGLAKTLASGGREPPDCVDESGGSRPPLAPDGTGAGVVLGTPAFMAPEQARGESGRVDERADVFGLGAILTVILTGRPAFTGTDKVAVLREASAGNVTDAFARLNACGADAELIALAKCCLDPDREQRPRTATEVAAAVQTYQTSVEERARKAESERAAAQARAEQERRARKLTLGLAAALLLVVVGGGIGTWVVLNQRAATNESARVAMDQVRSLAEDGWERSDTSTLAAAKVTVARALDIVSGGNASPDVRQQVEALSQDVEKKVAAGENNRALLDALVDISVPRETAHYTKSESGRMMALAQPTVEEQYASAFLRWGLNLDRDAVEEIVARLAAQPADALQEIVVGLDAWALERRREERAKAPWRHLLEVADHLDCDDSRKKLRRLLASSPLKRPEANAASWDRARTSLRERAGKIDATAVSVLGVQSLARVLDAFGETATAERLLRASLAAHPNEVVLLDLLGKLLEKKNPSQLAEAIGCYRAARAARPQLGRALAAALRTAKQTAESEVVFRDLLRRHPDNPELLASFAAPLHEQKKLKEAVAVCRKAIALRPELAEAHHNLAVVLSEQKKLDEAVAAFRKAIDLKPDDALAYSNLGDALRDQKKLEEAVAACEKAIALQHDLAPAYINLGNALYDQKKLDEAVAAFRKAVQFQPDDADAHYNLGLALHAQKKLDEAVAAFRKAIQLQPDLALTYIGLGNALCEQKKLDETVAAYRKAIQLQPDNAEAYSNISVALAAQKQLDEAIAACKKAIGIKPDYAVAYSNLGLALAEQKKLDEAVAAFRKAIQLQPDNAEAHGNLGLALHDQKKLAEAEAAYRKSIELQPDHTGAHDQLGLVLVHQKKLKEAAAAYRKAAQLLPNDPNFRNNLHLVERWLELEKKLPAILANKEQPRNTQERIELAGFCTNYKHVNAVAVGFFSGAFAAEPKLAEDLRAQHRYNAACAAALAAAGKGEDAKNLNAGQRGKLRQQCLEWLRADLAAYAKLAEKQDKALRQALYQRLSHWQQDADLVAVRDSRSLASLPEQERVGWQKLWEDVATLLKKYQ